MRRKRNHRQKMAKQDGLENASQPALQVIVLVSRHLFQCSFHGLQPALPKAFDSL